MTITMNGFEDDEEESFVVLDENPEDSIGQMSLGSLTMDQAVYTIGTLTQRVEQLTEALRQSGGAVPSPLITITDSLRDSATLEKKDVQQNVSSTTQTSDLTAPSNDDSSQTEILLVPASVQAITTSEDSAQQTEPESDPDPLACAPANVKDMVSDLKSAMERLSAEKMTCLTSISERDRRIGKLRSEVDELRTLRNEMENKSTTLQSNFEEERRTYLEVLTNNTEVIERLQVQVNEQTQEIQSKEEILRQQSIEIDRLKEEALSLRYAAQMAFNDTSRRPEDGAVMVNRPDMPPVPTVSYPYDSVPQGRRM